MVSDKYYMFHGKKVPRIRDVDFHSPKNFIKLGEIHAVEYVCSKKHGGGDGKEAVYRHEFETPAVLCMDERCKKQLYILGNDIIVTRAGIEN